jgi:hypothetical protein
MIWATAISSWQNSWGSICFKESELMVMRKDSQFWLFWYWVISKTYKSPGKDFSLQIEFILQLSIHFQPQT